MKFNDLALEIENNLVICDVHLGYEEHLNKRGIMLPRTQFKDTILRLEKIFTKKYEKIIINGDLKHEFGFISQQEWREVSKFIDFLSKNCQEVIIVQGNHDKITGVISERKNVKLVDAYQIDKVLIVHGDEIIDVPKCVRTIVIGHEHPSVALKESSRIEKFKCFLKGKWKGYNLIVQPSFNLVVEGSNVLKGDYLSPFLKAIDVTTMDCYLIGDKVYDPVTLEDLK